VRADGLVCCGQALLGFLFQLRAGLARVFDEAAQFFAERLSFLAGYSRENILGVANDILKISGQIANFSSCVHNLFSFI
jgi:hypothetical protein